MGLILFTGYNFQPQYVEKEKIVGMEACDPDNPQEPLTTLYVAVGVASEEWTVREPIADVKTKYEQSS